MMKNIFETVIRRGGYDLDSLLRRIDEYHITGSLTDMERSELIDLARGGATAASGMDVPGEIQKLWAAIRELQSAQGGGSTEDAPAFLQPSGAHDAYYTGDRVTFGGTVYTCVAPEGVACVWSPASMPDYWQAS